MGWHQDPAARVYPLVLDIVIETEDIQIFLVAAELRMRAASDHVPGLELAKTILLGGHSVLWPAGMSNNVDDGVCVDETRASADLQGRFTCGNDSADELLFNVVSAPVLERKKKSLFIQFT